MPDYSTQGEEMTLQERWPDLYRQLCEVRASVEQHFRDACDLEFTVESGKLYILGVRRARRTPVANVRIALNFYAEGKIELAEAVSRLCPHDVAAFVSPAIANQHELRALADGLPASPGAATGRLVLSRERADVFRQRGQSYIFMRIEVSPEDIGAMSSSEAVLTSRGGMTSHAAVACRGMGKPCVAGAGEMVIDYGVREVTVKSSGVIREGDWITVNGSDGAVLLGQGKIHVPKWQDIPELRVVARMIEQALLSADTKDLRVGSIWRIRDFFVHARPLGTAPMRKSPTRSNSPCNSSLVPEEENVLRAGTLLHPVSRDDAHEYSEVLLGLSDALSRMLACQVGLGNHHTYFRPLWDPQLTLRQGKGPDEAQFVAFQYFDINRYVHHLPDIADITFLVEVGLSSEEDEWFLDFTNPDGEGLVVNSTKVLACALLINGAPVRHDEIPALYNALRKREHHWRWFEYNMTSHGELSDFLRQGSYMSQPDSRLAIYCEELGLIHDGKLTRIGLSMLGRCRSGQDYDFFKS